MNINISDTPNIFVTTDEDGQNCNSENNSQKLNTYSEHSFGSEEFYILFLSQIEEKRKAKDDISYE